MEPNARKKTSAENDEHHYDSDTDLNKTFIESFIRTKKEKQPLAWTKDYYATHISSVESNCEPLSREAINGNESA